MQLKNLRTKFLGKNTFYYETIDSTQNEIWRRIYNKQIKDGTLIFTDFQTSGVGTHGRNWYTDEKNNIAFSLFVQMNCKIDNLEGLTVEIAEIIGKILENRYGIIVQIEKPNDIYLNGKKIGGILTQNKILENTVKYVVIGIGINTNKKYFTDDIKDIATSIKNETKIKIDTKEFITEFCNIFENKIITRRDK